MPLSGAGERRTGEHQKIAHPAHSQQHGALAVVRLLRLLGRLGCMAPQGPHGAEERRGLVSKNKRERKNERHSQRAWRACAMIGRSVCVSLSKAKSTHVGLTTGETNAAPGVTKVERSALRAGTCLEYQKLVRRCDCRASIVASTIAPVVRSIVRPSSHPSSTT